MSINHIIEYEYVDVSQSSIVCDTNIWYTKLPEKIKNKDSLITPWPVVFELFKASERSPKKIISNWERLRDNSVIIPCFPEDYFRFYIDNTLNETLVRFVENQKISLDGYNSLMMRKKSEELEDEHWSRVLSQMDLISSNYDKRCNTWLNNLHSYKKKLGSEAKENAHLLEQPSGFHDFFPATKYFILRDLAADQLERVRDLSKIELLLYVFNQYLIDFLLGKITPVKADIIDIYNMIYVRPIDRYWTLETKWIKLIKRVGMEKYLFNASEENID
ncbi:hypothetical protein [Spirosoma endophyticum]|uniref:PIN domain-containing protein n=1 Tax=Spirosoma endophyticum TaxID=662367 RepID=A0A1I2IDT0_9BACT|nr:hypothetical protein [Spirosoma endophyticum]SFF39790.1 hypothetical protein SAMN05216167_1663 [Spirosoma endophyticum]